MLPLTGVTVVSLEHAIAAPFATRQLADLGARVIKIERPDVGDFARSYDERVDGLSSHFVWCNRSKESLALDLKSEAGLKVVEALLARADVFVQNLAPGAVDRMGFGYSQIKTRFPRLIMCEISGYGQDGPDRDRKAYDLLIQAESGFLSVTGTESDMVKAGCSIADIAAGMYAYSNILAALIERAKTGEGRHIDVSMLEAMAEWMGHPMYYAFEGAAQPARVGASHATIFPYGPFPTANGDVVFAIQNEREWSAFCAGVLENPSVATDARFVSTSLRSTNREALRQIITDRLTLLDRNVVLKRLDGANIANADAKDMSGLWHHVQLAERGRWVNVETPAGPVPALLPPGRTSARMDAVPRLGAHTSSILAELGLEQLEREAS